MPAVFLFSNRIFRACWKMDTSQDSEDFANDAVEIGPRQCFYLENLFIFWSRVLPPFNVVEQSICPNFFIKWRWIIFSEWWREYLKGFMFYLNRLANFAHDLSGNKWYMKGGRWCELKFSLRGLFSSRLVCEIQWICALESFLVLDRMLHKCKQKHWAWYVSHTSTRFYFFLGGGGRGGGFKPT